LINAQRGFAADASHQLRTPLTALRLRLENLERILPDHGRANLDAAVTEIDRLAQMIDSLLALAQLDNGDTVPEPVDLGQIVAGRVELWAPLAAGHLVDVRAGGGAVGRVWAVPGALEQVLDNLISNSLRVAPAGSTITLAQEPAANRDDSGTPGVMLHIIDQGPGLTEPQRARAFDRFWRAPEATKGGSGLGLAIVQRLVQACGGQITPHPASPTGLDAAIVLRAVSSDTSPTGPHRRRVATHRQAGQPEQPGDFRATVPPRSTPPTPGAVSRTS
jgi:signal transduction histidine kinase